MHRILFVLIGIFIFLNGCQFENDGSSIVFIREKLSTDEEIFLKKVVQEYESIKIGTKIITRRLPPIKELQHKFYVDSFKRGYDYFDVMAIDVSWLAEFAQKGYLFLIKERYGLEIKEFIPGCIDACVYKGRLYGLPWFMDTEILYFRKDLLKKFGFMPPKDLNNLIVQAMDIKEILKDPQLQGFIWQGVESEELTCNFLVFVWANGSDVYNEYEEIFLLKEEIVGALEYMVDLIYNFGITSSSVVFLDTDEAVRRFLSCAGIFLLGPTYFWRFCESENSLISEKFGAIPFPGFKWGSSATCFKGTILVINQRSKKKKDALDFVRFLTSENIQKRFALHSFKNPTRAALFFDKEIRDAIPYISKCYKAFLNVKPRPVIPNYSAFSSILQRQVRKALLREKTPLQALIDAQCEIEKILQAQNSFKIPPT
jgi:multiple sugar transport system substrate-binding protein